MAVFIDRCVVTGGSGYFGSILCAELAREGCAVTNLDLLAPWGPQPSTNFVRGDVLEKKDCLHAFDGARVVFHCAAQVPLAKSLEAFQTVNEQGTRVALQAAIESKVEKFIYLSSSAVYGVPEKNPVTEETCARPFEAYGAAKSAGERICLAEGAPHLQVHIIRPRTILGPGRLGIFQILFEWIFQGANVPVFNGGKNVHQFIHASDLAKACILAASKGKSTSYNIGASEFGTMSDTLGALCEYARTGSKVKSLPGAQLKAAMTVASHLRLSPLGPYHAMMYGESIYFDSSLAKRELNWDPKYSNLAMLIESYDWYLCHRQELAASGSTSLHRAPVKEGALALAKMYLNYLA